MTRDETPNHQEPGDTPGRVVGENVKRLREQRQLTQHETVRLLRSVGVTISQPRVAALERGDRETVDIGTLILLAAAFDVPVSEFFAGTGRVQFSPLNRQSRAGVRRMLSSRDTWRDLPPEDQPETMRFTVDAVEADAALADRLDVSTKRVVEAAVRLWGRSLTEERDARVSALGAMEPGERQAHRGLVTRELAQLVEQAIKLESEHARFVTEWQDAESQARHVAATSIPEYNQHRRDSAPTVVDEWLIHTKRQKMRGLENAIIAVRASIRESGLSLPPLPEELAHLRESEEEAIEQSTDLVLRQLAELSEPLGEDDARHMRNRTDDQGEG